MFMIEVKVVEISVASRAVRIYWPLSFCNTHRCFIFRVQFVGGVTVSCAMKMETHAPSHSW